MSDAVFGGEAGLAPEQRAQLGIGKRRPAQRQRHAERNEKAPHRPLVPASADLRPPSALVEFGANYGKKHFACQLSSAFILR